MLGTYVHVESIATPCNIHQLHVQHVQLMHAHGLVQNLYHAIFLSLSSKHRVG